MVRVNKVLDLLSLLILTQLSFGFPKPTVGTFKPSKVSCRLCWYLKSKSSYIKSNRWISGLIFLTVLKCILVARQSKVCQEKIGLILGVTTDLFFEISIQNLISKLLTFIRKKWGTGSSDILPQSRNICKNIEEIKIQKTNFCKEFCQKNCQVLPIKLFLCKVTESIL